MASSDVIEVFIETLHGTAFELLVSPADTVVSIKSRISRLEGIPVSQQHLIWQCQELPDESSLHDCNITDGATLKLVLGMRGGPINTRKASLEDRPTLYDVAKYLDSKGDEITGLSTARLRAVRMVVMREGDKVHLYTVMDGASRTSSGLLSEDNTPRELSDGGSASEVIRRKKENDSLRVKMEQLQKEMRACRLRKLGKAPENDAAAEEPAPAEEPAQAEQPAAEEPPPPNPKYYYQPIRFRNTRRPYVGPDGPYYSDSPPWYPFPPGRVDSKEYREEHLRRRARVKAAMSAYPDPPDPALLYEGICTPPEPEPKPSRPAGPLEPTPLPTPIYSAERPPPSRRMKRMYGPPEYMRGLLEAAVRKALRRSARRKERAAAAAAAAAAAQSEEGGSSPCAVQGHCQEVVLVTTSVGQAGPSSSGSSLAEEEPACSPEPGHIYKVLPPVGRQQQGCSCVHPECERLPEQDLAAQASTVLQPLQLVDWSPDCDPRSRTAPARYVHVSVLRPSAQSTPPCSASQDGDAPSASAAGAAEVPEASSGPMASSSTSSAALLLDAHPTGADADLCDPAPARASSPIDVERIKWIRERPMLAPYLIPYLHQPEQLAESSDTSCCARVAADNEDEDPKAPDVERIRWILDRPMLAPYLIPYLRRPEQLAESSDTSRWARVAADNEGEDPKAPSGAVPTPNGPSNGSSERATGGSSTEAGSAATGAPEGSTTTVNSTGGPLMAEASSSSNLALSVDVGTATEVSSGNGMVQLDEDSSSTSESKTEDSMVVDPLHPSPGKAKKKGKRCSWCNKKTGLASTYVCRCGSNFCAAHRYAEEHACSHDYKTEGRYILQRNNPVVKAAKLPKI